MPQLVRLRPAPHCRTRILSYSLRVEPAQHFINWQQDPQANYLARLVFPQRTREFRVEVDLIAEMAVLNPFDFFLTPYAESIPFEYEATELSELTPYLLRSPAGPLFADYLAQRAAQPDAHHRFPGRAEPARCARYPLPDPHGAGRADAGADAVARGRLVPRLRLAAGAAAAPPGPGGALRLRLPDPAHQRRQSAGRAVGARARFHRPARLVRGLPARRGLDRAGSRLPACSPGRAIFRWPARPSRPRPRRSAVRSTNPKCSSSTTCRWRACGKPRA